MNLPINTILLSTTTAVCFIYGVLNYRKTKSAIEILVLVGASLFIGISNTVAYTAFDNLKEFDKFYNEIVSCYLIIEILCVNIFFKKTIGKKSITIFSNILSGLLIVFFLLSISIKKNIVKDFYLEFIILELILFNVYYFLFFITQINNPGIFISKWRIYFSNGILIFINISAPSYFIQSFVINRFSDLDKLISVLNDLSYIILFCFTIKTFTCLKKGI